MPLSTIHFEPFAPKLQIWRGSAGGFALLVHDLEKASLLQGREGVPNPLRASTLWPNNSTNRYGRSGSVFRAVVCHDAIDQPPNRNMMELLRGLFRDRPPSDPLLLELDGLQYQDIDSVTPRLLEQLRQLLSGQGIDPGDIFLD